MTSKDPLQAKLEKQVATLELAVKQLSSRVQFLERENNRRKQEVNQISSHLRKN
jgi:outer membrane murein-binding lipoprotein Lpp